jgi:hypothetical protein
MTEKPKPASNRYGEPEVDLDELFKNAPVWRKPGDLAYPGFFADDAEYQEFRDWLRTTRQRGMT